MAGGQCGEEAKAASCLHPPTSCPSLALVTWNSLFPPGACLCSAQVLPTGGWLRVQGTWLSTPHRDNGPQPCHWDSCTPPQVLLLSLSCGSMLSVLVISVSFRAQHILSPLLGPLLTPFLGINSSDTGNISTL